MDGIVSKLDVERGERVVGTSQMAGTEMLRIANFEEMEVLVDVNENDIVRLRARDTATVEVDAYPGRKFMGIVTQIANSAKISDLPWNKLPTLKYAFYLAPIVCRFGYSRIYNAFPSRYVGFCVHPYRNQEQCIGYSHSKHYHKTGTVAG